MFGNSEELAVASLEEKDCVYYCVMIITIIELRYVFWNSEELAAASQEKKGCVLLYNDLNDHVA
jgi:hypothetical protein